MKARIFTPYMYSLKTSLVIENENYSKFCVLGYGGTGVAIKIISENS